MVKTFGDVKPGEEFRYGGFSGIKFPTTIHSEYNAILKDGRGWFATHLTDESPVHA